MVLGGKEGNENSGYVKVTDRMTQIGLLNDGSYDCIVCLEKVKKTDQTFNCRRCFIILHLGCVLKWAFSKGEKSWECPACRNPHQGIPRDICYCEKNHFPPHSESCAIAHSCGAICGRDRDCGHPCLSICHPGPCDPCPMPGKDENCHCGQSSREAACGDKRSGWECGKVCQKLLGCGRHRCEKICHSGDCSPCERKIVMSCFCQRISEVRSCAAHPSLGSCPSPSPPSSFTLALGSFSCQYPCNSPLSCNVHSCPLPCHPGPCPPCETSSSSCYCGKLKLNRGCLDPMVTCGLPCNKKLKCGHRCPRLCHEGPCGDCEVEVKARCRCRRDKKKIKCYERELDAPYDYLCRRVCKMRKTCKRHVCEVRCCPALSGLVQVPGHRECTRLCNRLLKCGRHRCNQPCHSGPCGPCLEASWEDIVCPCGKTVHEAPIVCGKKLSPCPFPCSRRPCGHRVFHHCHEGECPPCTQLVSRTCRNGHHQEGVLCSSSCQKFCGKLLPCGDHYCERICHDGPCLSSKLSPSSSPSSPSSSPPCLAICKKKMSYCRHPCPLKCHPGAACPIVCKICLSDLPEIPIARHSPVLLKFIESLFTYLSVSSLPMFEFPFNVNIVQLQLIASLAMYYGFSVQFKSKNKMPVDYFTVLISCNKEGETCMWETSFSQFLEETTPKKEGKIEERIGFLHSGCVERISSSLQLEKFTGYTLPEETALIVCPLSVLSYLRKEHRFVHEYKDISPQLFSLLPSKSAMQTKKKVFRRNQDGMVVLG